jgi:hypothetical protein
MCTRIEKLYAKIKVGLIEYVKRYSLLMKDSYPRTKLLR